MPHTAPKPDFFIKGLKGLETPLIRLGILYPVKSMPLKTVKIHQ